MTLRAVPALDLDLAPRLPGDKSITHRAYLLALLGHRPFRVTGPNRGEDCAHTLAAVEALGVSVEDALADGNGEDRVTLEGPGSRTPGGVLDLGNSGTGLRLLAGVLAARSGRFVLTGDTSLRSRPMERIAEPLRRMGARIATENGRAPLTIEGAGLRGADHHLPVPSAQVKSALLLAGVQACGVTRVAGGGGSRDHTERLLRGGGVRIDGDPDALVLEGPQAVSAPDLEIPGDPSAAGFYAAAAAVVPGGRAVLHGVSGNPTRTAVLDALAAMGVRIDREVQNAEVEPRETWTVRGGDLRGIEVGAADVPALVDELPLLAVCAALAEGESRFGGAGELRHKESDRLAAMAEGLAAIGAAVRETVDGWVIRGSGGRPLPGGRVATRGDHRVGMAFLIAGLRTRDGVTLRDDPRIGTSDPYFVSNFKGLIQPQ